MESKELRKIVEDSLRHCRANVGFTLGNHAAAEENISMNAETIMTAVAAEVERARLEEAKRAATIGLIHKMDNPNYLSSLLTKRYEELQSQPQKGKS